jgi:transcriptional regulator with XRE-family HTH domain
MSDPSIGAWLRGEREQRGITLKFIADETKVSVSLLEGLEADDLSHWPSGIFRRGFVRAYAVAVGLDADEVMRRFEREGGAGAGSTEGAAQVVEAGAPAEPAANATSATRAPWVPVRSRRARSLGTIADLTVALVLSLGSAAAGSRLLWPVLFIAAYYALGVLLTGTSPMVALLSGEPSTPVTGREPDPLAGAQARAQGERRHRPRRHANRPARPARPRVQ